MQSLNINQLIINGSMPLSNVSQHVLCHVLDMKILEDSSVNNTSKLFTHKFTSPVLKSDISIPFDKIFQQSLSSDHIAQIILGHSSFLNTNMTIVLRSALISGTSSFRHTLRDFKMTHKNIFAEEINQFDKHQNTLLWYLTIAGLYSSIEELYQLARIELNINVKNGLFSQTILHYAVIHGNIEEIQIVLDIGVDTNLCDRFGLTALHYIALYGTRHKNDIEITKLLLNHGALPNLQDNIHRTSLHFAIRKENYDLVEYLITLPNINVCIKDKQGYTPLCYLCELILNLSDISLENNQCKENLEHIFKIINLIIDRCPSDELSYNFHITKNGKIGDNLLLHVYNKLMNLSIPLHMNTLFHRLQSIIIGTDQDHHLLVERLFERHSWQSAVYALCNTDNVNISNALIQCIAHDPHVLLINNVSSSSNVSIVFVLIFYALATNVTLLRNIVPICKSMINDEQKMKKSINDNDEPCHLYINNYSLHTTYITFIHTCLHYASFNVFSLKHLCRYYIRHYLKSHIIDKIGKCSYLKLKHCDYLKFNELLLIYSKIHDLSFIVYLIKRLYKIDSINEYNFFENEMIDNYESSSQIFTEKFDISTNPSSTETSDNDTIQSVSSRSNTTENEYETKIEDVKPVHQRTIKEIMVESDISLIHNLNGDQTESKHSSKPTIKTFITSINFSSEINHKSMSIFLDDENSVGQFENVLAHMKAKSKNIEEMIENFLLRN
ncbi:unnamed protein product [Rotaria sp. Silwood2]|nr:unnamed protein product [Rotaria sp. Silwood2]CAF2512959.1 unnamed protein product [Rotaria sp. Silwood2]CAF2891778.1 unnamed protein product [Rotaria sp. Silwood2]CAF4080931.1 unnamed protein product [Rotaria sp. Silwood2]CAF4081006.1 unnamed protein product [Rotaria sp. Silwood2]